MRATLRRGFSGTAALRQRHTREHWRADTRLAARRVNTDAPRRERAQGADLLLADLEHRSRTAAARQDRTQSQSEEGGEPCCTSPATCPRDVITPRDGWRSLTCHHHCRFVTRGTEDRGLQTSRVADQKSLVRRVSTTGVDPRGQIYTSAPFVEFQTWTTSGRH